MIESKLNLVVTGCRVLTSQICEFELRHPDGRQLPAFKAGAHISVVTPAGVTRSYSLVNDDRETERYVIAVKRENGGRGGSLSMHTGTTVGDLIRTSGPSNAFRLDDAPSYLFIAGGIGITPIMSMLKSVVSEARRPFLLLYSARSPEFTPYIDELMASDLRDQVIVHHDSAHGGKFLELWPFLKVPGGRHVYYCGPAPMMNSIYAQTIHWPRSAVHFEDFAGVASAPADGKPFKVRRASTDEVLEIPADRSVVDVFRSAGLKPKSSCESGTCGTCKVALIAGEPDHRDLVLSEDERRIYFMPCVSRSLGDELTLDI